LNSICDCYGNYGNCLYDAGCLDPSQVASFEQACEAAGCSTQQCDIGLTTGSSSGVTTAPATCVYECQALCGNRLVLECSCFESTGVQSYACSAANQISLNFATITILFLSLMLFI
jgi:hypothetical protein